MTSNQISLSPSFALCSLQILLRGKKVRNQKVRLQLSLLCIVFLLDFAAIGDIQGGRETVKVPFFVSVCLQRRELNNH